MNCVAGFMNDSMLICVRHLCETLRLPGVLCAYDFIVKTAEKRRDPQSHLCIYTNSFTTFQITFGLPKV
jgi:hypothetical protein